MRKEITERRCLSPYLYDFSESLVDARKRVDDLIEEYGEEAKLELEWDYEDVSLIIQYQRLETETEAERRETKSRKAKETRERNTRKKEEKERKELARLLEKYKD